MVRPGLARPIVIKMDDKLGEDIVRSNMRTLGITRKQFEGYLAQVRGRVKRKKEKP